MLDGVALLIARVPVEVERSIGQSWAGQSTIGPDRATIR
jgi:hypothetical protein